MMTVKTVSRWAQSLNTPEWETFINSAAQQWVAQGKTDSLRSTQGQQGPTEYVYTRNWINETAANELIAFIDGYTGATHISTVIEPITP